MQFKALLFTVAVACLTGQSVAALDEATNEIETRAITRHEADPTVSSSASSQHGGRSLETRKILMLRPPPLYHGIKIKPRTVTGLRRSQNGRRSLETRKKLMPMSFYNPRLTAARGSRNGRRSLETRKKLMPMSFYNPRPTAARGSRKGRRSLETTTSSSP